MNRPDKRSAIVLLLDGLNPFFLSPYGCTWLDQPAISQLAAESVTFERAVAETIDGGQSIRSVFSGLHPGGPTETSEAGAWLGELRSAGCDCVLFSDHPEAIGDFSKTFDEVFQWSSPLNSQSSVSDLSETHLAHCFASLLKEWPRRASPSLIVVHLTSLAATWDAPQDIRNRFRDPADPPPTDIVNPKPETKSFDPDEILVRTHAYAGQLETLDVCLSALLQEAERDGLLDTTLLMLGGLRGFPLGYHGQFGHTSDFLFGSALSVPLWIRFPRGEPIQSARTHELTAPREWLKFAVDWMFGEPKAGTSHRLLTAIEGQAIDPLDAVISVGDQSAISTPAWFLVDRVDRLRLFVKPDDRWEVNPVEDRCRWIANELAEVLACGCQQIRETGQYWPQSLPRDLVDGLE